MARSVDRYDSISNIGSQEDHSSSVLTESLSVPSQENSGVGSTLSTAESTQPTQPNLPLSPTQPNGPAQDSIWGVLEPLDRGPSIYLRLPETQYTFGRSSRCHFSYPDKQLSSKHCSVVLINEGAKRSVDYKVGVVDHQSLNGTFINEHRTIPERPTILIDGDVVFLTKMDPSLELKFKELSFRFRVPLSQELYQRYELGGIIGSGHFSKVYLGLCRITRKEFAVKLLTKSNLKEAVKQLYLEREIKIMLCISHPFILSVREVVESPAEIGLVMELAPESDLFEYYKSINVLSERAFHRIFYQVLSAVHYLHSNEIVHRDIKPENVLLFNKRTLHVKLSDFGLARFFEDRVTFSSLVGSPSYAAPEINNYAKTRSYTCACDMWSVGVMMFYSIFKRMPFNLKRPVTIQDTAQLSADWNVHSKHLRDLINKLLVFNPEGRYTAQKALRSKYFTKYQPSYEDLVKLELNFQPKEGALKMPRTHLPLDTTRALVDPEDYGKF